MFAYNGGYNRAGEIAAQGMNQAAAIRAAGSENMADNLGMAVAQLAKGYGDQQATAAKADAYGKFLQMHGPSLGLDPAMVEEFAKMKKPEQAQYGDMLLGSFLPMQQKQQMMQMQYGNRGGGGGGSGGGGAASGGGGGDYLAEF